MISSWDTWSLYCSICIYSMQKKRNCYIIWWLLIWRRLNLWGGDALRAAVKSEQAERSVLATCCHTSRWKSRSPHAILIPRVSQWRLNSTALRRRSLSATSRWLSKRSSRNTIPIASDWRLKTRSLLTVTRLSKSWESAMERRFSSRISVNKVLGGWHKLDIGWLNGGEISAARSSDWMAHGIPHWIRRPAVHPSGTLLPVSDVLWYNLPALAYADLDILSCHGPLFETWAGNYLCPSFLARHHALPQRIQKLCALLALVWCQPCILGVWSLVRPRPRRCCQKRCLAVRLHCCLGCK